MPYISPAFLILVSFLRTVSTARTILSSFHPLYVPRLIVAVVVSIIVGPHPTDFALVNLSLSGEPC